MNTVVKAHPKMCVCCNLNKLYKCINLYKVVTSCGIFCIVCPGFYTKTGIGLIGVGRA